MILIFDIISNSLKLKILNKVSYRQRMDGEYPNSKIGEYDNATFLKDIFLIKLKSPSKRTKNSSRQNLRGIFVSVLGGMGWPCGDYL